MSETVSTVAIENVQREYQHKGFALAGEALTPDEATRLDDIITDIVTNENNEFHRRVYDFNHAGRPLLHIKNMWKRYPEFATLYRDPRIIDMLHALTGQTSFRLWQDRFFYKPAKSGGIHTWHQDAVFLPFKPGYSATAVWISLNGADEENGAMWMVPGSYEWGNAESTLESLGASVDTSATLPDQYCGHPVTREPCPVPKGWMHIHDGYTWHCSSSNWSERPRNAIGLFYVSADALFDGASKWAKDYEGEDGQPLDDQLYPRVEHGSSPHI